jgi:hypothetical protein
MAAAVIDPTQLYGPNDHHFQFAIDDAGAVRLNAAGQPVAVIALPGLGPEEDAILLRESPKARTLLLDAREAEIRAREEKLAAEQRDFARELASLPKGVRDRLSAAAAAGE